MNTRYILLPKGGIRAAQPEARNLLHLTFDRANAGLPLEVAGVPSVPFRMLDSSSENGAKLVELEPATAAAINSSAAPLRALPEIIHPHPSQHLTAMATAPAAPAAATTFRVRCTDSAGGQPLSGQHVVAFDNYATRSGTEGTTNAAGEVRLSLPGNTIDRLFVLTSASHWGAYRQSVPIAGTIALPLVRLAAGHRDAIRVFYPQRRFQAATGVRVGVLDSGVGPHADLNLVGGRCTVTGDPPNSYADIAEHGTHVAGLIGGNGQTGPATLGLAPGVAVQAYRVFAYYNGRLGASNYAILKAMIQAAMDGCDILNLSLGGGPYDAIVEESVQDAREQGMLVVIAAGNDGRRAVSYPAAYGGATAVSAMGSTTGFPADCYFTADVDRYPAGTRSADEYVAAFSNIGNEIACTGLGSGVLSTLPGNNFGPMSGTSMASPMVAGAAASLLSQNAPVHGQARNRARSNAIERLLQTSCIQRFGGGKWEGYGLPDPSRI